MAARKRRRPVPPPDLPHGYSLKLMARNLGISLRTLHRWVNTGRVPSPIRLGNAAYYTSEQVATFADGPRPPGSYQPESAITQHNNRVLHGPGYQPSIPGMEDQ